MDGDQFRESLPPDSEINNLFEWFESEAAATITGRAGDRGDSGEFNDFIFDILDYDGETHEVRIEPNDLPDDVSWHDFFDYLEDWADEYDIDYENKYNE